jgi:LDH2 family malate/lactate/ureidoglycolate dehydrogenase
MDENTHYYSSTETANWIADAFHRCGVGEQDATRAAHIIVRTSLRGIDTHGLARVPTYIQQLLSGHSRPAARPRISTGNGFHHCDGDGALGQLAASTAMNECIRHARGTAMAACTVNNSGHMGALGLYALQASEQGLVAMICQRTPPIMALPGSTARAIGNNPIAFSLPVPGRVPLVFDMASSNVARGKVMTAIREKSPSIPEGWAIDAAGSPTTDPLAALAGAMLPMSGHKGIGLAMLVECLAGSLSGAEADIPEQALLPSGGAARASAFLLVLNPDLICGRNAFDNNVTQWANHYITASGSQARYPGERQAQCETQRLQRGLPIDAELLKELEDIGAHIDKPFDIRTVAPINLHN